MLTKGEREYVYWDDILYMVDVAYTSHYADFAVYQFTRYVDDGTIVYLDKDDRHVSRLSEAAVFLHGTVKWDGCSDWHIDECERCMLHFCERGHLGLISDILTRCWDLAAQGIERFDSD